MSSSTSSELSWGDILGFVRGHWRVLTAGVVLGVVVGVVAAILQTKFYSAHAVVVIVEDDMAGSMLGELPGGIGALAAATGISLGQGSRKNEYLAVLKSRALLREFIEERNLVPVIFAERWDAQNNRWKQTWRSKKEPNVESAVLKFDRKIRNVSEDRRAGLIRVEIVWRDRLVAAEWANELVRRANEHLRSRSIKETDDSLVLLRRELLDARSVELQQGINKLIETQIKSSTAAKVRPEFAFRTIDPAVPPNPEIVTWPRTRVFAGAGAIVGLLLALAAILILSRGPRTVRAGSMAGSAEAP